MTYKDPEKQKEYQRLWRRKRNKKVTQSVIDLLGGKCVDCENSDIRVLEIDHKELIRREKPDRDSYSSGVNLKSRILNGSYPLKKVELRCANCHKIRTFQQRVSFRNYHT